MVLALSATATAQPKDENKLQGTWQVTAMVFQGTDVPMGQAEMYKIVINGARYAVRNCGANLEQGTFKLDASKKTIDLDIKAGIDQGKKQLGTYDLSGERLTWTLGTPGKARPKDAADAHIVYVMKKGI
jgi:uncharacterized protein (TIGR03067 family)